MNWRVQSTSTKCVIQPFSVKFFRLNAHSSDIHWNKEKVQIIWTACRMTVVNGTTAFSCSSTAVEVASAWGALCGQQPWWLYWNRCLVYYLVPVPLLHAVQCLWKGIAFKFIGKHAVLVYDPWQVFHSIDTDISYVMSWKIATANLISRLYIRILGGFCHIILNFRYFMMLCSQLVYYFGEADGFTL